MATGYHPERSQVKDGTMAEWLIAPVTGSLLEVPGVGPATVKVLQANGVNTTYQLFAKFLSFKDEDVGPVELADRFYYWLDSIGTAAGQRGSVVSAVAEKLNLTFTGLYDPSLYALEEEG